jgi:predicted RNase H-like nuclease (RuvC/YqgF family)
MIARLMWVLTVVGPIYSAIERLEVAWQARGARRAKIRAMCNQRPPMPRVARRLADARSDFFLSEIRRGDRQVQESIRVVTKLRKRLESMGQHARSEKQTADSKISELRGLLSETEEQRYAVREKLRGSRRRSAALSLQIEGFRDRLDDLRAEFSRSEERIRLLIETNASLRQSYRDVVVELSRKQEQIEELEAKLALPPPVQNLEPSGGQCPSGNAFGYRCQLEAGHTGAHGVGIMRWHTH